MREKKEKKMREKRSKEGELQFCQHIFFWTWVRFLSTLTPLSRSLTIKSFFWDLIDETLVAEDANSKRFWCQCWCWGCCCLQLEKNLLSAFCYYFSWFIVKSNALCVANCLSDSVLIMIIQLQLHISDCKANIRFTADGWIGQIGTICVALIVVTSCNTTFWQLTLRFITCFHFKS